MLQKYNVQVLVTLEHFSFLSIPFTNQQFDYHLHVHYISTLLRINPIIRPFVACIVRVQLHYVSHLH